MHCWGQVKVKNQLGLGGEEGGGGREGVAVGGLFVLEGELDPLK